MTTSQRATADLTDGLHDVARHDYTSDELLGALRSIGIAPGDAVFFHVCLDALGRAEGCESASELSEMLLRVMREAVGEEGTILVPAYSFSFCKRELFDVRETPADSGPWSTFGEFLEYFRALPGAVRSHDPIHSVVGSGPRAAELLTDVPNTCFGAGSVHDRLLGVGGKICTLGVGLNEASFRHFVEEKVGVPFRFRKLFTGRIRNGEEVRKTGWVYNVRMMAENGFPDGMRLERAAIESGAGKAARVGRGEVMAADTRAFHDLTVAELERDAWSTAKGPAGDPVALEEERVGRKHYPVQLPENATMMQIIEHLWKLPRHIVSDAYDDALAALATQLPMRIHEYPSGTECWSWIVPEKWHCREAYLETMDGRRIFSTDDHPLHVVSYSLPFEGVVSRETLLEHLHVHPQLDHAIPFIFKYYERDWGLCCSREQRDSLTDESYRVVIRTDFSYATLKVGEVLLPGETDETIVLCAHLCHPAMVNDDITGVAVGMQLMRDLMARPSRRYTYRFLIVPETIGSLAYLSHHEELLPKIKGGLFLEMLGLPYPHGLQLSFDADTEVDECFRLAFEHQEKSGWVAPFGGVIGNDERQYNSPGVRIPMLEIARVLQQDAANHPYPQYHSSHDDLRALSPSRLEESRALALRMLDTLEYNRVPVNKFKGEVFCSRYGIFIDWYTNPEGNKALFDILYLVDGTRSIAQIARRLGISFEAVKGTVDVLARHGVVELQ
jgi:aminopeptidase-like protein/aminoglycoside N3'-acetyltransferase